MSKTKKGIKLENVSKIYQDPKTGKDFYAVKDTNLEIGDKIRNGVRILVNYVVLF